MPLNLQSKLIVSGIVGGAYFAGLDASVSSNLPGGASLQPNVKSGITAAGLTLGALYLVEMLNL
ncbi:MAG TPA: hypothetical protein VFC02_06405 [Anaerolineales bacterium]|nr:hypothetical protein [Anaerolineales bacterium]